MKEYTANYPKGIDRGPREVKREEADDVPTTFVYGGDLTPKGKNGWRDQAWTFGHKVGLKPFDKTIGKEDK